MVHALEEIHRLLKPNGVLIDIHPVSEASPIEIHYNGNMELVGHLSVRQWCIDFQQADNALAEIVQRNLFAVERQDVFDALTHYPSAAEMRSSLKESLEQYARDEHSAREAMPQVEALAAQAEERMRAAGGGAELIVRERAHISRFANLRRTTARPLGR